MRIMIVTPRFHPIVGGGETYILNLARKLNDSGHEVLVVTCPLSNRYKENYNFEIKEVKGLTETSFDVYQSSSCVHDLMVSFRPDIIHTHNYFALLIVGLVNNGKPVVASVHDTPVVGRRIVSNFNNYKAELSFAHNVVKISKPKIFISGSSVYNDMAKLILPRNVDLRLIKYPVDLDFFSEKHVINPLKINRPGQKLITVPSRIIERKGIAEMVNALDYMDEDYSLCLLGAYDPLDYDYWMHIKKSSSWINNVHRIIIPKRPICYDDLPNWYGASSAIVMPSYYEGYGLAALEAMASKIPMVGTDVQGLNEIINNNYNGMLVPSKDVIALAKATRRVCEDEALRTRLIKNGYRFASANS